MPDLPTYTLVEPVTLGTMTFTSLTFRKPTGLQLRTLRVPMDGNTVDEARMHKWIADLAGVPDAAVDLMCIEDWTGAAAIVAGFFQPAPKTSS